MDGSQVCSLKYKTKFGREMEFPGIWKSDKDFETLCGKIFTCRNWGIYLKGSWNIWDGNEHDWVRAKRPFSVEPIYLGKIL